MSAMRTDTLSGCDRCDHSFSDVKDQVYHCWLEAEPDSRRSSLKSLLLLKVSASLVPLVKLAPIFMYFSGLRRQVAHC